MSTYRQHRLSYQYRDNTHWKIPQLLLNITEFSNIKILELNSVLSILT